MSAVDRHEGLGEQSVGEGKRVRRAPRLLGRERRRSEWKFESIGGKDECSEDNVERERMGRESGQGEE
jgi:hypothetical protein